MIATQAKQNLILPSWPNFADDEIAAAIDVLRSGKVNYWTGHECHQFEIEFAAKMGSRFAISLMNGTVALEAALYALNIGPGDEVITSSRSFFAAASITALRGATPVFADVDLNSQNLSADSVRAQITPRTKAIIAVHLAGWPCDMDALAAIAKQHNLYLIEDCAQAHGAKYKNRAVGSIGHIGTYSFCQDKIMTTGGEGGMVLTNDATLYEKMWSMKDHGKSQQAVKNRKGIGFQWVHESFGTNWRMTEIQAAIGRIQLRKLDQWVALRQRNAMILTEKLRASPLIRLTIPPNDVEHAYYKFYIFIRKEMLRPGYSRDSIMNAIAAAGAPCFVGSCSEIYKEKAFNTFDNLTKLALPHAKALGEDSLMFLVHPTLSIHHMEQMAEIILGVLNTATQGT